MFTGLIEETGVIGAYQRTPDGARLSIQCARILDDLRQGDSVCVSGVCLTATGISAGGFVADISSETLRRTTLGRLSRGAGVNLERALRLDSRLGGHLLSGHVDGSGRVEHIPSGGTGDWEFSLPSELERYVVEKGSIAIDGVSLTVATIESGRFRVAIIPETARATNLKDRRVGDPVNLEVDILAKYVEKLLGANRQAASPDSTGLATKLSEFGYLSQSE